MSLPRVRFTMRQMIVIVAVLAVVAGTVEVLRRRRELFDRRAKMFAQKVGAAIMEEQSYRLSHRENRCESPFYYDNRTSVAYDRLVEHYDALRRKYEQAAARPWLFVEPDLREPDWPKGVSKQ